jgi:endonuclease/exonuclease/phosphatase (EEP) superfamily protein YafD
LLQQLLQPLQQQLARQLALQTAQLERGRGVVLRPGLLLLLLLRLLLLAAVKMTSWAWPATCRPSGRHTMALTTQGSQAWLHQQQLLGWQQHQQQPLQLVMAALTWGRMMVVRAWRVATSTAAARSP